MVLPLEQGFATDALVLLGEQDILGDRLARTPRRRRNLDQFIAEANNLAPGDLVVHADHGIGRYEALETIDVGGAPHDCVRVLYAGDDKLFVPVENIEVLSRFGSEDAGVQLDRLGGVAWQSRKARVKQRIRDIAGELIRVAAERQLRPGETLTPPEGIYEEFAARKPLAVGNSAQVGDPALAQDGEEPLGGALAEGGGATALSVTGADAIVNLTRSAQLGLARNFAVLISAPPSASLPTLMSQVRSVIGKSGQVVNLVSYGLATASQRPVATNIPAGAPANYLNLFKASAAEYCPGMSWTVLAAIGQIESGDGANNGPSSAGALSPMQFMPGTWAEWGINGFGPPGPPDIMNPLDAIPSAARMLCAAGAGNPATLRGAIFAYNHATWYVDEVLALAGEYARTPPSRRNPAPRQAGGGPGLPGRWRRSRRRTWRRRRSRTAGRARR